MIRFPGGPGGPVGEIPGLARFKDTSEQAVRNGARPRMFVRTQGREIEYEMVDVSELQGSKLYKLKDSEGDMAWFSRAEINGLVALADVKPTFIHAIAPARAALRKAPAQVETEASVVTVVGKRPARARGAAPAPASARARPAVRRSKAHVPADVAVQGDVVHVAGSSERLVSLSGRKARVVFPDVRYQPRALPAAPSEELIERASAYVDQVAGGGRGEVRATSQVGQGGMKVVVREERKTASGAWISTGNVYKVFDRAHLGEEISPEVIAMLIQREVAYGRALADLGFSALVPDFSEEAQRLWSYGIIRYKDASHLQPVFEPGAVLSEDVHRALLLEDERLGDWAPSFKRLTEERYGLKLDNQMATGPNPEDILIEEGSGIDIGGRGRSNQRVSREGGKVKIHLIDW